MKTLISDPDNEDVSRSDLESLKNKKKAIVV